MLDNNIVSYLALLNFYVSGLHFEAVFLTEVDIAGDKSRSASALFLKDVWTKTCKELGTEYIYKDSVEYLKQLDASVHSIGKSNKMTITAESSITNCLKAGNRILKARVGEQPGIVVVTGSLHIVSSMLATIQAKFP